MQYLDKCKCCLEGGRLRSMWDEYVWDGKREIYGEMLTNCFALHWQQRNNEERICELCVGRLRNAMAFKEQVLATELMMFDLMEDQDEKKIETEENTGLSDDYEDIEYLESEDLDEALQKSIIEINMHKDNQKKKKLNAIQSNTHNTRRTRKRKLATDNVISTQKKISLYDVAKKIKSETPDLLIGDLRISKIKTEIEDTDVEDKEIPTKITINNKHTSDHSYVEEFLTDNEEIDSTEILAENEEEVETTELETTIKKIKIRKPILRQLFEKNPEREKHQDNLRTVLICTNATPIRKRTDGGYMCAFCNYLFPEAENLKQHTIKEHDNLTKAKYMKEMVMSSFSVKLDITSLQCKLCSANIDTLEEILDHLKNVHDKKVHTDIKNHMIPLKFESDVLSCFMCGAEFKFFKLLTQHMSSFHYRNFECESCHIYFINNRGLLNHNRRHASGEFPCSFCSKIFDAKIKTTHHERTVHQLARYVIPCGFCHEKFKDNVKKLKHLEDAHGVECPVYKCDACERTFYRKKSLKRHVESYHLFMKKYKCTECEREFYERRSYEAHIVSHSKVKAHECEVCHRRYGVKWSLDQHRKIHYDEPKFKCEHCGHAFMQKNSWRLHMRKRHDEIV